MNGLGMRSSLSRSVSCAFARPCFGVCRNARVCFSAAPKCSAAHEDRPVSLRVEAPEAASPVKNAATFELPAWVKSCFTFLGAVALGLVLMLASPTTAEAARSGGRIGGSSFNSRSAGSSFSGSYSGSYSAPSRSAPSPGYSGGYGMRSPSVVVAPAPSFGFGLGFGYPAFGYGVPVASTGGSSLFTLLVLGIFAYVLFQTVTSFASQEEEEEYYDDAEPMSVVKLQVGLLGSARQIQRDLNRMANNIDTSTPQGLHYLLQETVLALRRNPQYACYGKATLVKTRGLDNAEAKFNQVSMEERGKFERETLTNFGGQRSSSVARVTGDGLNELIVVTIIAAIDGKLEPVDITSVDDLKTDLNLLGSVPASRLLALEVLWTPQDDNDYFTKEQLIEDYPMLNTI